MSFFLAQAAVAAEQAAAPVAPATEAAAVAAETPAAETVACQGGSCLLSTLSCPVFLTGLAIGAGLILLLWLIVYICKHCRKTVSLIDVEDERGTSRVTDHFIRSYVDHIVREFPDFSMEKLVLLQAEEGIVMEISMISTNAERLHEDSNRLRERIYSALDKQLAISSQIGKINFIFKDYEVENKPKTAI